MKDKFKLRGRFTIEVKDKNGNLKEKRDIKNTITNAGMAEVANLIGSVSTPAAFTYLALGTGTTAAAVTDTALQSELTDTGLARAAATMSRVTTNVANDTTQLVKTWTATGSKAITECGVLNAASTGILLGRQVFSAINTATSDQVTVTYKIIVS